MAKFKYEGFAVESASASFTNGSLDISDLLQEFRFTTAFNLAVPSFYMKLRVDTSLMRLFTHPFNVDITLSEKHYINQESVTYFHTKVKFLTTPVRMVIRDQNPEKLRYTFIEGAGVDYSMYRIMNTPVDGYFEQTTVEDVIRQLWDQVVSGSDVELYISPPDNNIAFDILIPRISFRAALNYLLSTFGLFMEPVIVCTEYVSGMTKKFYIAKLSDLAGQYQPLTLYLNRPGTSSVNIDSGSYASHKADVSTANSSLVYQSKLPKSLKLITHPDDELYRVKAVNSSQYINVIVPGVSADLEHSLRSTGQDVVSHDEIAEILAAESYSTSLIHNYKYLDIIIDEPFRFDHWQIGQLVNISPENTVYLFSNINTQVLGKEVILTRQDSGRWRGTCSIDISAKGPQLA